MEHFLQGNVPLRHLLNAKPAFMSWRRTAFNEVNDWAQSVDFRNNVWCTMNLLYKRSTNAMAGYTIYYDCNIMTTFASICFYFLTFLQEMIFAKTVFVHWFSQSWIIYALTFYKTDIYKFYIHKYKIYIAYVYVLYLFLKSIFL